MITAFFEVYRHRTRMQKYYFVRVRHKRSNQLPDHPDFKYGTGSRCGTGCVRNRTTCPAPKVGKRYHEHNNKLENRE